MVGVASTEPFFQVRGAPVTDADGNLLGIVLGAGQAGAQSMVKILDVGGIRKSLADWQKASPTGAEVHLIGAEAPAP